MTSALGGGYLGLGCRPPSGRVLGSSRGPPFGGDGGEDGEGCGTVIGPDFRAYAVVWPGLFLVGRGDGCTPLCRKAEGGGVAVVQTVCQEQKKDKSPWASKAVTA